MTWTVRRGSAVLATLVALAASLALWAGSASARTISVSERARLHLVRKSGSVLYEAGTARGTISGAVSARLQVGVATVSGVVTIFPRGGGSLSFSIAGTATSLGRKPHFAGRLTIQGGTRRYRGAHGSGRFNGVVNRRTWAGSVTATGRLAY